MNLQQLIDQLEKLRRKVGAEATVRLYIDGPGMGLFDSGGVEIFEGEAWLRSRKLVYVGEEDDGRD